MRDFHAIEILRGVSHVLAPRDSSKLLQLSEVELPLNEGVRDILGGHVQGGIADSQAKAASFVARGADRASGAFARLLGPDPDLIEISQHLAQSLYAVVESDARISDGTLAVLLCRAVDETGAVVQFPALLKLDPSATLHTITDVEPGTNRVRVRYEVDPTTLPSKNERIQKCAFVRAVDPNVEYEMLVVDRQRRQETVSQFWVRDFLGAEFALDAPERTKRLYKALQSGRNDVEQQLDSRQLAALDQVINGTVVQATVNLDTLVAALPVPAAIRTQMGAALSRVLPDREFDLDPGVSSQFLRRRTFVGDNGLRLSVPAEFFNRIRVEDVAGGDATTPLRRVSFETRTWKES